MNGQEAEGGKMGFTLVNDWLVTFFDESDGEIEIFDEQHPGH